MKWERIDIQFQPLKISKLFHANMGKWQNKPLLYEVDSQPSLGRLKNQPPAIKLDWFLTIKDKTELLISFDASDIFKIEEISEYKTKSGRKSLREMIEVSHTEVFQFFELAKKQFNLIIAPVPAVTTWSADAALIAVEELLDKEL